MIEELRKPQSWAEILILTVAFYFILGAVLVFPIWLIVRLMKRSP